MSHYQSPLQARPIRLWSIDDRRAAVRVIDSTDYVERAIRFVLMTVFLPGNPEFLRVSV